MIDVSLESSKNVAAPINLFVSLAVENFTSFSPPHTMLCLHSYRRLHTASVGSPDLRLLCLVSVEGFSHFFHIILPDCPKFFLSHGYVGNSPL